MSLSIVKNKIIATFDWYDQFVTIMDRVQDCKLNVVLLGDFNTDMQKSKPCYRETKLGSKRNLWNISNNATVSREEGQQQIF